MALKKRNILYLILALIAVSSVVGFGYTLLKPKPVRPLASWTKNLPRLGTLSSPRLANLNGDGILDIVMGAGGVEFSPSDSAIIALDGVTGQLLWSAPARDQIFGSPLFRDLTGDGIEDLLVATGGYVKAPPGDPNRPAGKLLVVSSASGKLLASADMPDGKETYMSVLVADFRSDGNLSVVFGTGGETLGGSLYRVPLAHLLQNDLSQATLLEPGHDKGFVAPPVLADITQDGVPDIIANSVNGRMVAIDGATEEVLWRVAVPGTEAYCSIAVGYFTDDDVPDFFTNFGIGIWPDLNQSIQLMVNGKTGRTEWEKRLGSFQESTPLAFDFNGDGFDDACSASTTASTASATNLW
ncbi:hypothetical protein BH24BAC1_BH24BAC1_25020 [soil metagenome]